MPLISRNTLAWSAVVVMLLIALAVKSTPVRPFLTAEMSIAGRPMTKGEVVKGEASWSPLEDVDVVGWAVYAKTNGSTATLLAADRRMILVRVAGGSDEIRPHFVTAGTSYRLRAREQLTLRLDVPDAGDATHTHRTMAQVYYVPTAR